MTENNGTIIEDIADPQNVSFTPETAEPNNPVEAAMQAMEKEGAKFGDENDATPEPKEADKKAPKAEDAKADKAAEEKPVKARSEDGKFAKADKAEDQESVTAPPSGDVDGEDEQEQPVKRPSGDRDIDRAPAHFLPRAKEKWNAVDADVRSEVMRHFDNLEKGLEQGKADREFRKSISHFEEMAKNANTTVPAAIERYVAIDQELRTNPENGIARILATVGLTPQQYANHILKQAQADQQNPAAAGQRQLEAQLQSLRNELQAERTQRQQQEEAQRNNAAVQHVETTLFAEVREHHPRFDELRPIVYKIWNSDVLPSGLNERERLYAAVDYAERLSPAHGRQASNEPLDPAQNAQRPLNPAGKKSIKGAPGGVAPTAGANLNGREAIEYTMRKMGL